MTEHSKFTHSTYSVSSEYAASPMIPDDTEMIPLRNFCSVTFSQLKNRSVNSRAINHVHVMMEQSEEGTESE